MLKREKKPATSTHRSPRSPGGVILSKSHLLNKITKKKSDFLRAICTDGLNYLLPDRESRRRGEGKKKNSRGKSVQENERAADEPQLSEALTKAQLLRAPAVLEILIAALTI